MKSFNLNENSGYIHRSETHASDNAVFFDRADAADVWGLRHGIKVTFCKTCFGADNPNVLAQQELETPADAPSSPINIPESHEKVTDDSKDTALD